MISRSLLTLMLLAPAAPSIYASEEPSPSLLPLPALSTSSVRHAARRDTSDTTTPSVDRSEGGELVDCFYDWNKNDPACTTDSSTKSARP